MKTETDDLTFTVKGIRNGQIVKSIEYKTKAMAFKRYRTMKDSGVYEQVKVVVSLRKETRNESHR